MLICRHFKLQVITSPYEIWYKAEGQVYQYLTDDVSLLIFNPVLPSICVLLFKKDKCIQHLFVVMLDWKGFHLVLFY